MRNLCRLSYALKLRPSDLIARAELHLLGSSLWDSPLAENDEFVGKVLHHVKTGIIITNPSLDDNPIVYVNKGFENITGYTAAEVLGRNPRFLYGSDSQQEVIEEIRKAVAAATEVIVKVRNYTKEGQLFINEVSISPSLDEDGRPTYFLGLMRDVTPFAKIVKPAGPKMD